MSKTDNVNSITESIEQNGVQNYIKSLVDNQVQKSIESKLQSIAESRWKITVASISDKQNRLESTLEECCLQIRELSENIRSMKDAFDEMKTDIEGLKNINKENAIIWQKFEGKLKSSFDKFNEIDKKVTSIIKNLSSPKGGTPVKGQKSDHESKSASLELRLSALEVSVGKAMDVMLPRVDILLSEISHKQSLSNDTSNSHSHENGTENCDSVHGAIKKKYLKLSESGLVQNSQINHSCGAGANVEAPNSIVSFSTSDIPRQLKSKTCTISNLLQAAKSGRVEEVCALLESGINVNGSNEEEFTALHIAAEYGHVKLVEHLLNRGADVNVVDCNGMTPIFNAASNCHVKCLMSLLQAGSNVNIVANDGTTVLHRVAMCGDRKTMEALLAAGVQCRAVDENGWTALHWAATWGSVETTVTLLENGFPPSIGDQLGMSPLHWAVTTGREDTAEVLLMAGATFSEIQKGHMTPAEVNTSGKVIKNLRVLIRNKYGENSGYGAGRALPNGSFTTRKPKFKI